MKTHLILVGAIALSLHVSVASATFPAPLPKFQTKEQLAARNAERQAKTGAHAETPLGEAAFYTGKPFEAEREGYLFKYRSYAPQLNRWSAADPSGFPDGANIYRYAATPTRAFDYQGLLTVNLNSGQSVTFSNGGPTDLLTMTGILRTATTNRGNQIEVIQLTSVVSHTGSETYDPIMNCHGYVYLPGYWIDNRHVGTILADEWTLTDEANAKIVVYGGNQHSVNVFSKTSGGSITAVIGKDGHHPVVITGLHGTGYSGPAFYE